jgi:hypothetical protein
MWHPLRTTTESRPDKGALIAHEHTVWKVTEVADRPLSEEDRQVWLDHGMPDLDTWNRRPYEMAVEWVGGAPPSWAGQKDGHRSGVIRVPAGKHISWRVYKGDRWPQCSCCGEPMPCRAELEDHQVTASLDRVARLESIPPGACWACSEPITSRQQSVTYPGENIYLPGGQQPVFHTRRMCVGSAHVYEEKWLAADPRRERILTWPRCGGILIVHADGSNECVSGRHPLGQDCESQPDCRGHDTHDHGVLRACYVHEDYFGSAHKMERGRCPRGCDPGNHGGTRTKPRPKRRQPSTGALFQ